MITMDVRGQDVVANNMQNAKNILRGTAETNMSRAQRYFADYVVRTKLRGQVLKQRSGELAGSIKPGPLKWSTGKLSGVVGTRKHYSQKQEEGGVLRSRKGGYMTIPIGRVGTSYRKTTGLELRPRSNGPGYVALKDGKPLWILVKQVRLPARPYFAPSVRETRDNLINLIGTGTAAEVIKTGSGQ